MTTPLVQSITDEMVAELEALAKGARPECCGEQIPSGVEYGGQREMICCGAHAEDQGDVDYFHGKANPATILALLAERKELVMDRERLNWLADPDNTIGNVQLPLKCVTANVHSLRDAIDAARGEV